MKKVKGGKSRAVHPVSEYVLPVEIMNLADALSPDDKQILSYLISFTPSSSIHNHIKNTTTITTTTTKQDQVKQQHMPVFNCDCFSCYTSYWSRWNISPNRLLIHHIIDAYEDHLSSSSSSAPANKKISGREIRKKKKKKKRTQRAVVSPSNSELTTSDSVVTDNKNHDLSVIVYRVSDGVSVEEDLDDDIDDDEKGGGGSNIMNKFVTFIANKLWN